MARYVMVSRRAGKFHSEEKTAARAAVGIGLELLGRVATLKHDFEPKDPTARRVTIVEGDARELEARRASMPADVIFEPEVLHSTQITPPPPDLVGVPRMTAQAAAPTVAALSFKLQLTGGGNVLPNAQVMLYLQGPNPASLEARSDASGYVYFQVPPGCLPIAALATPVGGFWSMVARPPADGNVIECPPLPRGGPGGWWHRLTQIDLSDAERGAGIKVGHIDTGVGPHPNLSHVRLIATYLNGQELPPASAADVMGHGTHTAGIIGARPQQAGEYTGMAPGCDLLAVRVFPPGEDARASSADIVLAIDRLSRVEGVDLINMSLAASDLAESERDAVQDALERGTLCICAAGNSAGDVGYPAAFPETVAVSALGQVGWGPPGSLAATRLPLSADRFGQKNLYLANFSCFGPQVTAAGPGVGIISTVTNSFGPDPLYAAMDGTSMACPWICGVLAALLARDSDYKTRPRDVSRSHDARMILERHLNSVGLSSNYQGGGILMSQ